MKIKSKKLYIIIFLIIGVCVAWIVTGYFVSKNYYQHVQSKPKRYAYQTYWGVVNPVLYVTKTSNIDSLITYYKKIENGDDNPIFNFPPLSLPYDTCVYVLGYERDSAIAKVICYYDWGKQGHFVKGYVYTGCLHNLPPPDSLISKP